VVGSWSREVRTQSLAPSRSVQACKLSLNGPAEMTPFLAKLKPEASVQAEDSRRSGEGSGFAVHAAASTTAPTTTPKCRFLSTNLSVPVAERLHCSRAGVTSGIAVAKAAGKLRGRSPKLSPAQEAHLVKLYHSGQENPAGLAELFNVGRSTVHYAIQRAAAMPTL